uniref:Uncharacterized protein n=1 Tax=Anguilla anguilla TaxID=7936 RepID=A0A0E9PAY3_ANGAN
MPLRTSNILKYISNMSTLLKYNDIVLHNYF